MSVFPTNPHDTIQKLREELASLKAQSTEPVAWCHINYEDGGYADCIQPFKDSFCTTPLFAAAPRDEVQTLRRERDELLELVCDIRFILEPYDDIKPRDWKSDRENLRRAHQACVELVAAIDAAKGDE